MLAASLLIPVVKKKRKTRKDSEQHGLNHGLLLTRRNKLGLDNTFLQEFHLELEDKYKCFLRKTPGNFKRV